MKYRPPLVPAFQLRRARITPVAPTSPPKDGKHCARGGDRDLAPECRGRLAAIADRGRAWSREAFWHGVWIQAGELVRAEAGVLVSCEREGDMRRHSRGRSLWLGGLRDATADAGRAGRNGKATRETGRQKLPYLLLAAIFSPTSFFLNPLRLLQLR